MTAKKKNKSEAGENPLVPNARLREIYTSMLAARAVEDAVTRRIGSRRTRIASIRGQEALRASATLQLGDEDLVCDSSASAGMGSILGANARELIKSFSSRKASTLAVPRLLPLVSTAERRLNLALGAALALKTQGRQGVVVAYIRPAEISTPALRSILNTAATNTLPVIFIAILNAGSSKATEPVLSRLASNSGVPGIPVDIADSVAVYRVVQESLGRLRGGDGPVLIECLRWKPIARGNAALSASDPVEHLEQFLLARKVVTPAWIKAKKMAALKRLKAK